MMIPGFVAIIVIEVSYVWQKKNSFGPKCHGFVFFCSASGQRTSPLQSNKNMILYECLRWCTALQKKDTSVTFWAERIFFLSYIWHFYDNNCDKTRYHHRCGGLLLLWQKIMTENGLFILGGPGTHLHDILWAVHDIKNRGRIEIFAEFPITVGGRGRAMRVSLVHARAWVRGVGL